MNRNRTKGFTLIELLIVIAIIAILLAVAFGAFPRKAGAQTVAPNQHSPVWTFLTDNNIPFLYAATRNHLTILSSGTDRWATAAAACAELKAKDARLAQVTLSNWSISDASVVSELGWTGTDAGTQIVTNLDARDTANCL